MHVAAVDAGGTRTRFELRDLSGSVLAEGESATCHPAQVGVAAMAQGVLAGVARVCGEAGVPLGDVAVSVGLAGFGPGREGPLREALEAAFPDAAALLVTSDAEAARLGALGGADGVLVVAGTGSIAVASFDGKAARTGGWGWPVGDEGSGSWLGREAAGAVLRQLDGRDPESPVLSRAVCRALGAGSPEGIVSMLARTQDQRRLVARAAPAVLESAAAGDQAAQGLLDRAAAELARLAEVAAAGHPCAPVSWTGGLFSAGDALLGPFVRALAPGLVPTAPAGTPLDGAWLAAVRELDL